MSRPGGFSIGVAAFVSMAVSAAAVNAATDCQFSVRRRTMTLRSRCTTDATILVPDGFTLDGRGFTITAVDPPEGHFVGPVVRNAGTAADVHNLRIAGSNLSEFCNSGEDKLRGIALVGASGSIVDNEVSDLNQASGHGGCQEGTGIEAQNVSAGAGFTDVLIDRNVVRAYQKTGIAVSGNVRAQVRDNQVAGFGPVEFIAQNGIQIGFGADVVVADNAVSANSYTGPQNVLATGILIVGGPTISGCLLSPCPLTIGTRITRNLLLENDGGVFLDNPSDTLGAAPETSTDIVVQNNDIAKSSLTNGMGFQAGVLDVGNHDRIIGNTISGAGYNPAANPAAFTVRIFAEAPFAINPIIRRNRLLP